MRWRRLAALLLGSCVTLIVLGVASRASAQPPASFYETQSGETDELGLSAAEQTTANSETRRVIRNQILAHNGSIVLGFVPSLWISVPAEIAGVTADTALKFTRAVLDAPGDIEFSPSAPDPAFPADGACLLTFELPQAFAKYGNFLGIWPRIQYPSGDVDRLFRGNSIQPGRFGVLGSPEIYHANSDVNLSISIPSARSFAEASLDPQTVVLEPGVHDVIWRADTLYAPFWDTYLPAALIPVLAAMEFKFGKYIDELSTPAKLRSQALELASIKSNLDELAQLLEALNRRIKLYQRLNDLVFGFEPITTESIVNQIANGQPSVSRWRNQRLTVYDDLPPTIEALSPTLTFEATDIGGARTTRYLDELMASVTGRDACGRPFEIVNDAPELLPLGDTSVTWTVRDMGPVRPGIDHDGDGIADDDAYNSRTVTQVVTIEDIRAPIIVPPPGVVIESATDVDVASQPLGQPLVVDLADLHPTVSSSTPNASGVVTPDTRTIVTWTATDASGNSSAGNQLVTVKTPGTNTAPTVSDDSADTLTSKPIEIVLSGFDADMLPYTDDLLGPTVADPLQFRIVARPQNGEFVVPLLPFFINDHRTDTTGVLTDDVAFAQAVNQLVWLDDEYCANGQPIPVNFVYKPLYVHVTDAGETYFLDHYAECGPFGESAVENIRISRWAADRSFLGHVDYNPSGGTHNSSFVLDRDGKIYYLLSFGVNEYFLEVCDANITGTNGSCTSGYLFDGNNGSGLDISRSKYARVDSSAAPASANPLIYLTDGRRVNIYQGQGFRGQLVDDQGSPDFLESIVGPCQPISGGGSNQAYGMEVDSQGNLYVADTCGDRIHKFTPSRIDDQNSLTVGEYVGWMGQCSSSTNLACDVDAQHSKGFSCTDLTCSVAGDGSGSGIGQFHDPVFLAVDPNDVLYVADYTNQRVQRFAPDGTFGGQASSTGNGINADTDGAFVLGNMGPPRHVSVNSEQFFVVDRAERFVHVFATSPFKDVTDSSATVTYVSNFAFHSDTDTFQYAVNDGLIDSNVGTVSVNVARNYRQPLPMPQAVTASEDSIAVIVLSGTDPDGILTRDFNGLDSLTFTITREPEHGRLIAGGDPGGLTPDPGMEVYTYVPDRDYYGPDSFAFTVRDEFTDQSVDGGTAIPVPYGEAEPAEVSIAVEPVNDIPIVRIEPPERIGVGFDLMLRGTLYDDRGGSYAATVSWGDGQTDRDGEVVTDNSGTPTDPRDDVSFVTGVVYSADSLGNIGQSPVNAAHIYSTAGPRTVTLCLRDPELLEACDSVDVNVESLVALGAEVTVSETEIFDGIPFTATIDVENSVPSAGVTGLGAADVRVAMELPADLLLLASTPSQGSCAVNAGVLECALGEMPNGAIASIDLSLRGAGTLIYDTAALLMAEVTTATPSVGDYGLGAVTVTLKALANDRDSDGLPNIFEAFYGVSDPLADDDGDGLDNRAELDAGTSPISSDTDGDGISDGAETSAYGTDPLDADSDGDGLGDFDEITAHGSDPLSRDSDADGLPDQWEVDNGFDPVIADSDGDADLDGLSDADEYVHGTDYLLADSDGDGLSDGEEVAVHGTDPASADTDGDGLEDAAELVAGTDALKPDSDDDGLDDGPEMLSFATSPILGDTDRDGVADGWEVRNGRNPLVADYAVAAGGLTSCALSDAAGGVECWGRNTSGEATPPSGVNALENPQALTVGYQHTCAIDRSAAGATSVVCWGSNTYGQSAPPPLVAPFQVAAGGYHTCALDRTTPTTAEVVCWGRDVEGQVSSAPTSLTNPVHLAATISGNASCVLDDTASGPELVCWGLDGSGQVSGAPTGLTSLAGPLAMGSEHGCLVDDGELRCWGLDTDGQAPQPQAPDFTPISTTAVALALGGFHSCALDPVDRDQYAVSCWGRDVDGQASVPAGLVQPLGIAAGSHHTCALDDGAAKCWGVETQFNQGQAPALRVLDIDPDGDGIATADELTAGTDPLDPDTDRDGLSDLEEQGLGTDPRDRDSDDDGLLDGDEVNLYSSNALAADTDGDGLPDEWEVDNGTQLLIADAAIDVDADGLDNAAEFANGTDPQSADTDGDTIADGAELDTFRYDDSGQALGSATSEAVALGDLDGDGDLDAFVGNQASTHDVWLNDGTGVFSLGDTSALNASTAADVDLFDADFDGDLDAYLSHPDGGVANSLWLNDGAALYSAAPVAALPPGLSHGAAYGRVALAPPHYDMGVFIANSGQNQAASFRQPLSQVEGNVFDGGMGNSEDVALADFNGDGLDDAFVVNRGQPDQIFVNTGDPFAFFIETTTLPRNDASTAVELGDLDHDGDVDAYEVVDAAGDRLWINDGAGGFTDSGQSLGSDAGTDVRLVDLDGDGYPEALVANAGPNRVWLNTAGVLADSGAALGAATTLGVDVGDLDGDGDPDAFFANAGPNEVWLLNRLKPGEVDTDGDGAFDGWEIANGFDPLDATDGALDPDGDGLTNFEEFDVDSDPFIADSDGDGMPDGYEVANGLDPLSDDGALDRDVDGLANIDEFLQGGDPQADDVAPDLTVPPDVTADSTGALTAVAIGQATAVDARDGPVLASVDDPGPYVPGDHLLTWSASDLSGNLAEDNQSVGVTPLVSFAVDQTVAEGDTAVVGVLLNGTALAYPVVVDYTVSGAATNPEDHNAVAGSVVIETGTQGAVLIDIVSDFVFEGPETFTLTMTGAMNAVPGTQPTHAITITQANVKPTADIVALQNGRRVTTAYADRGPITVMAEITDPNVADSHTVDWSASDPGVFDPASFTAPSYTLDPAAIADGTYDIVLDLADDGVPIATNRVLGRLRVARTTPALSAAVDSDGDGISDFDEGATDGDGDGVPDYLDNDDAGSVLPYADDGRVLETLPGLQLRLGAAAFAGGAVAQRAEADVGEEIDYGYPNGIADFEITGVEPGANALVVVPLRHPLPANASYRKHVMGAWHDFVVDDDNAVASAPGGQGACPAPGSAAYVAGLNQGDACVELTIQDGGPNDADLAANGTIVDPGGVAVPVNVNVEVIAASDRTVAAPSAANVVLTLRLTSDSGDVELRGLTLAASGTGDDRRIERVNVVLDANGNGAVDADETTAATGTFTANDGELSLALSSPLPIPAGQTDVLVTYDF